MLLSASDFRDAYRQPLRFAASAAARSPLLSIFVLHGRHTVAAVCRRFHAPPPLSASRRFSRAFSDATPFSTLAEIRCRFRCAAACRRAVMPIAAAITPLRPALSRQLFRHATPISICRAPCFAAAATLFFAAIALFRGRQAAFAARYALFSLIHIASYADFERFRHFSAIIQLLFHRCRFSLILPRPCAAGFASPFAEPPFRLLRCAAAFAGFPPALQPLPGFSRARVESAAEPAAAERCFYRHSPRCLRCRCPPVFQPLACLLPRVSSVDFRLMIRPPCRTPPVYAERSRRAAARCARDSKQRLPKTTQNRCRH